MIGHQQQLTQLQANFQIQETGMLAPIGPLDRWVPVSALQHASYIAPSSAAAPPYLKTLQAQHLEQVSIVVYDRSTPLFVMVSCVLRFIGMSIARCPSAPDKVTAEPICFGRRGARGRPQFGIFGSFFCYLRHLLPLFLLVIHSLRRGRLSCPFVCMLLVAKRFMLRLLRFCCGSSSCYCGRLLRALLCLLGTPSFTNKRTRSC